MNKKILLLAVLTILSLCLTWPRQDLIKSLTPMLDGGTARFPATSGDFTKAMQMLGFPMPDIEVSSYDLIIINTNKEYAISYSLVFGENNPVVPYFEKVFGKAPPSVGLHPGFIVQPNRRYSINDIPVGLSAQQEFGFLATCGLFDNATNCPSSPEQMEKTQGANIQIFAVPKMGLLYIVVRVLLTVAFWGVIINNVLEFIKKPIS